MIKGITLKDDDWGNFKLKDVSISLLGYYCFLCLYSLAFKRHWLQHAGLGFPFIKSVPEPSVQMIRAGCYSRINPFLCHLVQ